MELTTILAAGRADYILGRKAALRGMIWFAYGAFQIMDTGTTKEQNAYFDDLRAMLRDAGAVKSAVSTKAKQAKQIGAEFAGLFRGQLASDYATTADMIQACFVHAHAAPVGWSGISTTRRAATARCSRLASPMPRWPTTRTLSGKPFGSSA